MNVCMLLQVKGTTFEVGEGVFSDVGEVLCPQEGLGRHLMCRKWNDICPSTYMGKPRSTPAESYS